MPELFSNWDSAEIARELAPLEVSQREALAAMLRADGCLDLSRVSPQVRGALLELSSGLSFLESGDDPAEQGRVLRISDGAWPALCAALEGTERRQAKASEAPIQAGLSPPPTSERALEDLVQHGGLSRWGAFDEAQRQQLSDAAQSPWGRGRLGFFETRRGLVLALNPQAYLELDARPRVESWLPARPDWALAALSVLGLAERGELKLRRGGSFTKTQRALLGLNPVTSSEPSAWELAEPEALLLETLLDLGWIDSSGAATEDAPPRQASALELLTSLRRGLLLALELRDEPSAEQAFLGLCGSRAQSLTSALDRVLLAELWENPNDFDHEFEDRRLRSWAQVAPIAVALGLAELGLDALGAPVSLKPRPRLPQQLPQILTKRRQGRKVQWELECAEPLELLPFARFGFVQRTGNRAFLELSALAESHLETFVEATSAPAKAKRAEPGSKPRARLRESLFLELPSADLMDQLLMGPEWRPLALDRLSATVLLITDPELLSERAFSVLTELGCELDGLDCWNRWKARGATKKRG